jgi:hypothetical protein
MHVTSSRMTKDAPPAFRTLSPMEQAAATAAYCSPRDDPSGAATMQVCAIAPFFSNNLNIFCSSSTLQPNRTATLEAGNINTQGEKKLAFYAIPCLQPFSPHRGRPVNCRMTNVPIQIMRFPQLESWVSHAVTDHRHHRNPLEKIELRVKLPGYRICCLPSLAEAVCTCMSVCAVIHVCVNLCACEPRGSRPRKDIDVP